MGIEFVKAHRDGLNQVTVSYQFDGIDFDVEWSRIHPGTGEVLDDFALTDGHGSVTSYNKGFEIFIEDELSKGEDSDIYLILRDTFDATACLDHPFDDVAIRDVEASRIEGWHPDSIAELNVTLATDCEVIEMRCDYGYNPYSGKWGVVFDGDHREVFIEDGFSSSQLDALEGALDEALDEYFGVDFSKYKDHVEKIVAPSNLGKPIIREIIRHGGVDMDEMDAIWECQGLIDVELKFDPETGEETFEVDFEDHSFEVAADFFNDDFKRQVEDCDDISTEMKQHAVAAFDYYAREAKRDNLAAELHPEELEEAYEKMGL